MLSTARQDGKQLEDLGTVLDPSAISMAATHSGPKFCLLGLEEYVDKKLLRPTSVASDGREYGIAPLALALKPTNPHEQSLISALT
jgi:hypothetical protein